MTGPHPELHAVSGQFDPRERRGQFEAAHPQVTILPPATLNSRWLAVFPPGSDRSDIMRTTLGGWQLEDLLDQLDTIFPPDGED